MTPALPGPPGFSESDARVRSCGVPMADMIAYFRTRCSACGHHRIMHDEGGACEGVMNKPCGHGCESFSPE